jgi:SAM-dependent methyltransferase
MTQPPLIYGPGYAESYDEIYLHPWRRKHEVNLRLLAGLIDEVPRAPAGWVDLGCGQAWQFSRFEGRLHQLGIDLSPAQLARARERNPRARFVCADLRTIDLPAGWCSLVTCFWGAYCYLDDTEEIAGLIRRACHWLRPGGALYFEILPPENLAGFNDSEFAYGTGFRVTPRGDDYGRWSYEDPGGRHLMTSPPTASFLELLGPLFGRIDTVHTGFMVHLVASGRCAPGAPRAAAAEVPPTRAGGER